MLTFEERAALTWTKKKKEKKETERQSNGRNVPHFNEDLKI